MEIKGTIILAMPEVSGTSKAGNPWKKREYVLENTEGTFPRKVAFTCFGANADSIILNVGDKVVISFDIESREYNGRWYTEVRCWRAVPDTTAQPVNNIATQPGGGMPDINIPAGNDEEFPF